MESHPSSAYNHTCVQADVDWITATCQTGDDRLRFDHLGQELLEKERAAGVEVKPAALRDYRGFRAGGLFAGRRRQDSLIKASGSHAPPHWKSIARVASNVSRLDIQATVWTHGEQPALNVEYYEYATKQPNKRGRPRSYDLRRTHPQGDTFYVGDRQSDYYGRLYDYASAHKEGQPRTLWRWELELKRQVALGYSRTLLASSNVSTDIERLVHQWFEARGLLPTWAVGCLPDSQAPFIEKPERDTLQWIERSLQVTVRKAINRHGLTAVLDALGLSGLVIARRKED